MSTTPTSADTADGKLTVRLEAHPRFILRGSASTGFRAPSLAQSYFSAISTNFLNVGGELHPFEVGTFPVSSPQALALGAEELKPEESVHYSGGFVWTPIDGARDHCRTCTASTSTTAS